MLFIKNDIEKLKSSYKSKRFCVWVGGRIVQNWFIVFIYKWKIKEVEYNWEEELKAIVQLLESRKIKILKIEIILRNNIWKIDIDETDLIL